MSAALQRRLCILNHDLGDTDALLGIDDGARSTRRLRRAHELIGIEVGTAQRDEQLAALERAGIAAYPGESPVRAAEQPAARLSELCKRALHAPPPPSAALTTA